MSTHSLDCKLYGNSSSYGSPVWKEADLARDVTQNDSVEEGDDSSRGKKTKSTCVGQFNIEWSTQLIYDPENEFFALCKARYEARAVIGLAAMDDDITVVGTKGKRGDFVITTFNRSEPMSGPVVYDVTFKPSTANGKEVENFEVSA